MPEEQLRKSLGLQELKRSRSKRHVTRLLSGPGMHICEMTLTRGYVGLLFDAVQTVSEPFLYLEEDDVDGRLQHIKWAKHS